MNGESAVALFQRLMAENNLSTMLTKPVVKYIENGGVIIEQPQLQVSYNPLPQIPQQAQSLEQIAQETEVPVHGATQPATEAVAQEAPQS